MGRPRINRLADSPMLTFIVHIKHLKSFTITA